jgi:photosynthesis system II assembly factor YCF48-like protein
VDPLAKLVAGRLKEQVPGPHPDPELLAAFAGHALPDADRGKLLQHLGACSDCREILYLAMPDSAEAQRILSFKPKPLPRFALRWGTLAASVAIAGIFFVTGRHRIATTPQQKSTSASYAPSSAQIAKEKRPAELDELRDGRVMRETRTETKTRPAAKHMTAKLQAGLTFDQSEQVHFTAPVVRANRDDSKQDASRRKDKAAATTISGLVNSKSVTNAVTLDTPKSANESVEGSSESVAVAEPKQATAELQLKKSVGGMNRAESAAKVAGGADALALAAPQWTLSGNGEIQRSTDAGETWQKVAVASGTVFRALSAVGTHVWAGGSAGVLYHSADSGQTWIRVEPVSDGHKLTADVTHIDFAEALNGTLNTASGEVWSTSDGGQSWHRK